MRHLMAVMAVLAMAACGNDETSIGESRGELTITLPNPGAGVNGFLIEVFEGDCATLPTPPLLVLNACVGFAGAGVANHFVDHYFVLPATTTASEGGSPTPGHVYCVRATPKKPGSCDTENLILDGGCNVPTATVTVTPKSTQEVTLLSNCLRDDTGGLDVKAVINHDPVITSLVFNPSKYACAEQLLKITATANEPDKDLLIWTWKYYTGSAWADLCTGGTSNSLAALNQSSECSVSSPGLGNWSAYVTACDPAGLCAQLNFPLHVSACPE